MWTHSFSCDSAATQLTHRVNSFDLVRFWCYFCCFDLWWRGVIYFCVWCCYSRVRLVCCSRQRSHHTTETRVVVWVRLLVLFFLILWLGLELVRFGLCLDLIVVVRLRVETQIWKLGCWCCDVVAYVCVCLEWLAQSRVRAVTCLESRRSLFVYFCSVCLFIFGLWFRQ